MESNVKFIFKTLVKVPIIIFVSYFIFNVFAFSLSYFKMLGLSYVVLQTAIENNYLPTPEKTQLDNYIQSITNTAVLENGNITCTTERGNNARVQYGGKVTVTISAHYRFLWPLMPDQQNTGDAAVVGWDGTANTGVMMSDSQLEAERERMAANPQNNINISYTVPGLKYYPDLS